MNIRNIKRTADLALVLAQRNVNAREVEVVSTLIDPSHQTMLAKHGPEGEESELVVYTPYLWWEPENTTYSYQYQTFGRRVSTLKGTPSSQEVQFLVPAVRPGHRGLAIHAGGKWHFLGTGYAWAGDPVAITGLGF